MGYPIGLSLRRCSSQCERRPIACICSHEHKTPRRCDSHCSVLAVFWGKPLGFGTGIAYDNLETRYESWLGRMRASPTNSRASSLRVRRAFAIGFGASRLLHVWRTHWRTRGTNAKSPLFLDHRVAKFCWNGRTEGKGFHCAYRNSGSFEALRSRVVTLV